MRMLVDLHLHGRFSIATSKSLDLDEISFWAGRKGIMVVGTGDIVHPAWLEEAEQHLKPDNNGLYQLRKITKPVHDRIFTKIEEQTCRFMLTTEISTIYSDGGRVRKVHHLVVVPSLESAHILANNLSRVGNIQSDGRPILGITSRDLLEIVLESDDQSFLIPAHIWTPWFSVLGSKSGYESIEECYKDLTEHIFAIETGLSSDPAMNWRVSSLDRFAIVSNSDAHSARRLGREATILDCDMTFYSIRTALGDVTGSSLKGTIEFFPEEGKYHLDGHRKCGIRMDPVETVRHGGTCPVCGKPLTIGVFHRVGELADRPSGVRPKTRPPFYCLLPLDEVLSQVLGRGVNTRTVKKAYNHLIETLGAEIDILLNVPLVDIEIAGGDRLAEGISNLRNGDIVAHGGYDGEYGTISIFGEQSDEIIGDSHIQMHVPHTQTTSPLNSEPADQNQRDCVVNATDRCIIVVAGPGSGKTHLLTERIARVLSRGEINGNTSSRSIGITFTRAAARSLKNRVLRRGCDDPQLWVGTLHQLCFEIMRQEGLEGIICEDLQLSRLFSWYLRRRRVQVSIRQARKIIRSLSRETSSSYPSMDSLPLSMDRFASLYEHAKRESSVLDYDDLIRGATTVISKKCLFAVNHLFVDEFQDIDNKQYEFIMLLARDATSILAIGDPQQSIYGFRGASPVYIRNLESRFETARSVMLQTSFRCGQQILDCAGAIIGNDSSLRAHHERMGTVELIHVSTPHAEARMIAGKIRELIGGSSMVQSDRGGSMDELLDLSDIAVLVRTSRQIPVITLALEETGIPYRASTSLPLLAIRRFERIAAWIRLAQNKDSIPDLLTLGEGGGELLRIQSDVAELLSRLNGLTPWEAVQEMRVSSLIGDTLSHGEWDDLGRIADANTETVSFLQRISTEDETGIVDPRATAVRVMTMHASKGLEFGAVFIAGFKDGIMPLKESDLAEEERLCYVALTRAKYHVCLSWSGAGSDVSRFASRLPENIVHRPEYNRHTCAQLEIDFQN